MWRPLCAVFILDLDYRGSSSVEKKIWGESLYPDDTNGAARLVVHRGSIVQEC